MKKVCGFFTLSLFNCLLFLQYTDSHYRSALIDALAATVTPGVSIVTTNRHEHIFLKIVVDLLFTSFVIDIEVIFSTRIRIKNS